MFYNLPPYRMAHLTRSQRDQLHALVRAKQTQISMASILGCSQSTISRELKRNSSMAKKRYTAIVAHRRACKRRRNAYIARMHWYDNPTLLQYVVAELRDGKSPDQIAGRLKERHLHSISHQSIYAYVESNKEQGGSLYRHLRYQGKKYKWRGVYTEETRGKIPNRKGIEERPEEVNLKIRFGDWESDLVVSGKNGSGALATFAERTGLHFRAILLHDQSAEEMVRATKEALKDLPENLRRTMTHDNGKEISKHEQITKDLHIDVYCARPYRSCDRGLNEWYNRELRRFFPKGTDFSKVTQKEVDRVVNWLNNCPRRSLNYRTPNEVLEERLRIMRFTL